MATTITVSHIEVIQVIQDINNCVPLIEGKKTFARVFFQSVNSGKKENFEISGKIKLHGKEFISQNSVSLVSGQRKDNLDHHRSNWKSSLNFDITSCIKINQNKSAIFPGHFYLYGKTESRSHKLKVEWNDRIIKSLSPGKDKGYFLNLEIYKSPSLSITALVFNSWDSNAEEYIEPRPEQVDPIRQFVEAAFPVSKVTWNTTHVRVTEKFRSLNKTNNSNNDQDEAVTRELMNLLLQTALHRNQNLFNNGDKGGQDIRTLYLGVFVDPSNRLGGAAIDSPAIGCHNIVGVASIDENGETGAHEIAHLLGRGHPGVPNTDIYGPQIGQRQEDSHSTISDFGFLSKDRNKCIGLHVDPRSAEPKLYEYNRWFDLMTYRYPKWVSSYTYSGILDRLTEINGNNTDKFRANVDTWLVIGEYDLDRKSGNILYVLPTAYKTQVPRRPVAREKTPIQINPVRIDGNKVPSIPVYINTSEKRDMPNYGVFQVSLNVNGLEKIELDISGRVVSSYEDISDTTANGYQRIVTGVKTNIANKHETNTIEHSREYLEEQLKKHILVFAYSVEKDEYHIRYNWAGGNNRNLICSFKAQIFTTFQCKNPSNNLWETVLVTSRIKGKVWISPKFLSMTPDGGERLTPPRSFIPRRSRPIRERLEDTLEYRVIFTSGFRIEKIDYETIKPVIEFPKRSLETHAERITRIEHLEKRKERNLSGQFRPLSESG